MIQLKKPLSYSSLSRFIKGGWEEFINPVYKKSIFLEKGTIIDKIVFNEPITEEIVDIKVPRPQIKDLIEYMINNKSYNLRISKEALGIKAGTLAKLSKELKENKDYIEYFKNSKGKFLKTNYDLGKSIAEEILKDDLLMFYFSDGKAQFEHTFEYKGFPIYVKLDYFKVDDENRDVYLVDLKSSSYPPKFKDSVIRYNYHLQGKLYLLAIEDYLLKNEKTQYSIKPFIWIVTNSLKPGDTEINVMSYLEEVEAQELLDRTLDDLRYALENNGEKREIFEI